MKAKFTPIVVPMDGHLPNDVGSAVPESTEGLGGQLGGLPSGELSAARSGAVSRAVDRVLERALADSEAIAHLRAELARACQGVREAHKQVVAVNTLAVERRIAGYEDSLGRLERAYLARLEALRLIEPSAHGDEMGSYLDPIRKWRRVARVASLLFLAVAVALGMQALHASSPVVWSGLALGAIFVAGPLAWLAHLARREVWLAEQGLEVRLRRAEMALGLANAEARSPMMFRARRQAAAQQPQQERQDAGASPKRRQGLQKNRWQRRLT